MGRNKLTTEERRKIQDKNGKFSAYQKQRKEKVAQEMELTDAFNEILHRIRQSDGNHY